MFVGSVQAAEMPDEYTLFCRAKKSTGYNWRSDDWVNANFLTNEYIVSKRKSNSCIEFIFNQPKNNGFTKEVCINIRETGDEYIAGKSGKCTEFNAPTGAKWTDYLDCDGFMTGFFKAKYDGWFHKAQMHTDLEGRKEEKDSLTLEVGTCSRIN